MKFGGIFVITFLCTLYISERSNAQGDDNFDNKPANDIMGDGSQRNTVERDENLDNKPAEHIINGIIYDGSERNAEISDSITDREFEIDASELLRKKKGNKNSSPKNCQDIYEQNRKSVSGTYKIYPCDAFPSKVVEVYCDMNNGGGWTMIQRRNNYATQQDFYLTWYQYVLGFGDIKKDFWLGNDNINCLTEQTYNEIRFDLEMFNGTRAWAIYDFFYILGPSQFYKLHIGKYTGTAGDSFSYHNGMHFSTWDQDHDKWGINCAERKKGAWWYNNCYYSNLNGLYNSTSSQGVNWYTFNKNVVSLKATEMKIRPKY